MENIEAKSVLEDKKYSIGEVGRITGLEPYVLRFWESEFDQLSPEKNEAGRRNYRQSDIDLIFTLKELLHKKKYTIEGAKKYLQGENEAPAVLNEPKTDDSALLNTIRDVRQELEELIALLA